MSDIINQNSAVSVLHQENKSLFQQELSIFRLLNQSELILFEFLAYFPCWSGAGRGHFARGLVRPAPISAWMLS
jgi:hypothetical protein